MACGQLKFGASGCLPSVALSEFNQGGNQALADGGERELLDDSHEAAQAGTYHDEHFERYLGMIHAIRLEIAPRDKSDLGVFDGDGRGGKRTAVKDGQLGDGF